MIAHFPHFTPFSAEYLGEVTLISQSFPLTTYLNPCILISYSHVTSPELSHLGKSVVLRFFEPYSQRTEYVLIGGDDVKLAISQMLEYLSFTQENRLIRLIHPVNLQKAMTDQRPFLFGSEKFCLGNGLKFLCTIDEGDGDYIYSVPELVAIKGGKLSTFRQNINQFFRRHTEITFHYYDSVTAEIEAEILAFTDAWIQNYGNKDLESFQLETTALSRMLTYKHHWQLLVLIARCEGNLVGYSLQEIVSPEIAIGHFGKTSRQFNGLASVLEFYAAKELHKRGVKYLNNDEDMGIPSLRLWKNMMAPIGNILSYTISEVF